jgi:hypothetical protein
MDISALPGAEVVERGQLTDAARLRRFMHLLGRGARATYPPIGPRSFRRAVERAVGMLET